MELPNLPFSAPPEPDSVPDQVDERGDEPPTGQTPPSFYDPDVDGDDAALPDDYWRKSER